MLFSCETVRIPSPAFYKDPPLHESQFRSPADVEINSLASFDAARVKDLFVLLPWLLPLRLGCSARRLGSAARHSSKAAWRLGSPARHGGALRQLATPRGDSARRPRRRAPRARLGSPAQRRGAAARRRSARRRNGETAKRLARLGSAPRAATRPRVGLAAQQLGRAAALRRTARRLCGGSAARRLCGVARRARRFRGFVVLICKKKKPKPN
jgi:hypothetical protein